MNSTVECSPAGQGLELMPLDSRGRGARLTTYERLGLELKVFSRLRSLTLS